jgi:multidrug transporter EmrE-like cation transporter
MTFGFAALFVTPMVSMIGVSLSKWLSREQELAVLIIILGAALIAATLFARARRSIAHLVSAEWRFIAKARKMAESLRSI